MGKRLWLLLALIGLNAAFTASDWKDSLALRALHQSALELHRQSRSIADAASAPSLESQAWTLIGHGQELRNAKLFWQSASFFTMVIILGIGLRSFQVSEREARRRTQAEADLLRERASLEQRIEARTAELRAEVEERRRAEERNRRQKRVLELLAAGAPLEDIFRELTASVAGQRRSWECAVHLVDTRNRSLRLIAASQVSEWLEHYLNSIATGFPDAPEGAAWTSGEPCILASMIDRHRPWGEFLASNGIRSVWSFPLPVGPGSPGGTLTVYSRLFGIPDDPDRELLDSAARLASLVVDVRRMNSELQRKAYEDELTGVANRRAGELRLAEAIARARTTGSSFAVLWVDLDRFKRINDLYGHACGDRVLLEVAGRLASHPSVQGSVARMGGDEFLVLLESCTQEADARQAAGELTTRLTAPILLDQEPVTVGASIGITLFPRDGHTPDELERHADAAMYQAKRRSLGWYAFSPALRKETDWALIVEEALRAALDSQAPADLLEVHYQPIFTAPGRLMAFEALLRFRHPELGPVSPAQFIPVAEETKLIVPIGRWVLRQACRQIVAWQLAGLPSVRVCVNISAVQWGREDFVEEVRSLIDESGAPASALTLELTESVVMQNAARARAHMTELKTMGVRVAMDDFGTGYSSLSYLHQLPLDILKIDRSFIARLGQQDDSRAIVESVISMAHLLGITTIAEGVETGEQHQVLTAMGCDALQGFLFARPMPAREVAGFVAGLAPQARAVPVLAPGPVLAQRP